MAAIRRDYLYFQQQGLFILLKYILGIFLSRLFLYGNVLNQELKRKSVTIVHLRE